MQKRLVVTLFALALLPALLAGFAATARAQAMEPRQQAMGQAAPEDAMGLSSAQRAILAETWTLTPQRTARAGFTGLPLRNCEGFSCGVLATMPIGTQVDVLLNDREGWALAHVPSLNLYGWVNTNNIF